MYDQKLPVAGEEWLHKKGEYPESVAVIDKVEDGHVYFYPQGGGFQYKAEIDDFLSRYRPVDQEKDIPIIKQAYVSAEFFGENEKTIPCYTTGDRWNGWACPMFDIDAAMRVMEGYNEATTESEYGLMSYDVNEDKFMIPETEHEDAQEWKGFDINIEGKQVRVYDIGAYSWCWYLENDN